MHFLDSNSSDVNLQPGLGVVTWVSRVVGIVTSTYNQGWVSRVVAAFVKRLRTYAAETDASGRRCPDDLTAQRAS